MAAAGMAFGARRRHRRFGRGEKIHGRTDESKTATEPFFGPHQAGIATPQQAHTYCAVLDLVTAKRDEVVVC